MAALDPFLPGQFDLSALDLPNDITRYTSALTVDLLHCSVVCGTLNFSFSLFFISVPKVDADEDAYLGDCLSEWLRHAGAGNSQIRTLQESGVLVLSSMDEKLVNRTSKNLLTVYLGFDMSLATNLKSCIGKIKELWETCGNLCWSKD